MMLKKRRRVRVMLAQNRIFGSIYRPFFSYEEAALRTSAGGLRTEQAISVG
jgi:hypothetical protein